MNKEMENLQMENETEEFKNGVIYLEISSPSKSTCTTLMALISSGADVQMKSRQNQTYLHVVAKSSGKCPSEVVDDLVSVIYQLSLEKLNVNAVDRDGNTALHIGILNEAPYRIIAALLKVGVDPTIQNNDLKEALNLVNPSNQILIDLIQSTYPGILKSVSAGDMAKTKYLLDANFSVDLIEIEKISDDSLKVLLVARSTSIQLAHAALAGNVDRVRTFFQSESNKPDPNVQDEIYISDDGFRSSWPLLAQVIQLKYFEIAKILLESGADVNVCLTTKPSNQVALYQYAFDKIVETSDKALLKLLLQHADANLLTDAANFLHRIWKDVPALFDLLLDKGASLSARNKKGYTVRDLIFNDVMRHGIGLLRTGLLFVDEYVIAMALEKQQLDQLEVLALEGYEYIDVENKDGKTVKMLAREANKQNVVDCLENISAIQKKGRLLQVAIRRGNIREAKQYMEDGKILILRDKAGRQALHQAVLFERPFIVNHIVKTFPSIINNQDFRKRTPLHYANGIPDSEGEEFVDCLIAAGADQTLLDDRGRKPSEYIALQMNENFIEKERMKNYGGDVFLIDRYVRFVNAIKSRSLDQVREVRETLWDTTLDDLMKIKSALSISYRPLLMVCVENMCEDIAIYLIEEGANWRVPDDNTKSPAGSFLLLREAQKNKLEKLIEYLLPLIDCARREQEADDAYRTALSSDEMEFWSRQELTCSNMSDDGLIERDDSGHYNGRPRNGTPRNDGPHADPNAAGNNNSASTCTCL